MDKLTESQRSYAMSRVRAKGTAPEMVVRRVVHAMGYRYRLHERSLPGCPDLVFRGRRKVIFVHGCFWHLHEACAAVRPPKSRCDYWGPKLEGNRRRDDMHLARLAEMGWKALVVWECELADHDALRARLRRFLDDDVT